MSLLMLFIFMIVFGPIADKAGIALRNKIFPKKVNIPKKGAASKWSKRLKEITDNVDKKRT